MCLDVRNSSIAFEAVTQNVQASANMHSGWAGIGVQRINNSKNRFHRTVCDTSFEVSGTNVHDRGACGF
jgi:hypothetical protein